MGTEKSAVWEGFTRVTAESVYTKESGFGWQSKDGLKAQARAYTTLVENRSRGTEEPPPIWTNPITEDAVLGSRENAFLVQVPPGEYEVYVMCGTSEPLRNQYFDFTVQVGRQEQRVQFEGGYQFRSLRFRATAGDEPLAVSSRRGASGPSTRYSYDKTSDAPRIEKDIIAPLEEWTYNMPPAEWAKWKEDPEPEPGPMPPVSEADKRRGFLVYARHYLECIYRHTRPRPEELNPSLRLFATPGEYEPATFAVHPLVDLTGAKVSVTAIGPVPAANIDVRHVRIQRARPNYTVRYRYRWVPDVLEHFDTLDLKAGENARFWLTIRVPDDAPAGTYSGKVTFECSGGKAELPVTLRILPFKLRDDPQKIFGIYYYHPYDRMAGADDDVASLLPPQGRLGARRHGRARHAERRPLLRRLAGRREGRVPLPVGLAPGETRPVEEARLPRAGRDARQRRRHLRQVHEGAVRQPPPRRERSAAGVRPRADGDGRGDRGRAAAPRLARVPLLSDRRAEHRPGGGRASWSRVLKACKAAGVRTYVTADPTHDQFEPLWPYIDVWCTSRSPRTARRS